MTAWTDRFWAKVDKSGDCWIWTASTRTGYGQFCVKSRTVPRPAHRLAYELLIGEIPDGLTLDHLCRNRACVNPAHLEPVTVAENLRRGVSPSAINARKTHCKNGHPLSGDNLYTHKRGRACRICVSEMRKRLRERNLEHYKARERAASRRYKERKKELVTP